jgi:hypothetical protein
MGHPPTSILYPLFPAGLVFDANFDYPYPISKSEDWRDAASIDTTLLSSSVGALLIGGRVSLATGGVSLTAAGSV